MRPVPLTIPIARLLREATDEWGGDWRLAVRWLVLSPFRWQTAWNAAWLTFGLPLGFFYLPFFLLFLVGGVTLSLGLVGIPMILIGVAVANRANGFERQLAWRWLGVAIPAPFRSPPGDRWFARVRRYVRDPVTWTSLAFLMTRLPLGGLAVIGLWQLTEGVTYLLVSPLVGLTDPRFGDPGPLEAAGTLLLGAALVIPSLHAINGVAFLYGRLARLTLGPSDARLQVATSQAEAARARSTAERAEQSRRELMVNVSHELRTPVASIRGHVESLLIATERAEEEGTASVDPAQFSGYLTIIHRETERLGALVDDLLALARSEAGELSLIVAPVQAGDVVREVHETLAPLAWRDREVTVIADVPDGLPLALADRDRLAQVLLNLVRNAITYTPAGGIVSLTATAVPLQGEAGPLVEVAVADTGSGIAPDDLSRIFERFYRVDASRNRASGGFGLGLSIVHDLVTAMGGTITAESQLGEGSRFCVRLRAAPAALPRGSRAVPSPVSVRAKGDPVA